MKLLRPTHPYIPMACGFLYLVAIIDWASRAVLAWRLSNTNDASFCAAALEEALIRFGKPRIFNTDQGSTFTAEAFTSKLVTAGVVISMDGRGRFMDNIFIERLWRSIKYEEVHLKAYADGCEARSGISSWMNLYNFRRKRCFDIIFSGAGVVAIVGAKEGSDTCRFQSVSTCRRERLPRGESRFSLARDGGEVGAPERRRRLSPRASRKAFGPAMSLVDMA